MSLPLTQSFAFTQPRTSGSGISRKRKLSTTTRKAKKAKLVAIPRPKFTSRTIQGAFPSKKRVTLTYVEYFNVTTSITGAATGQTFRLNGAFDPNQSGVGHQPMAWDQWSPMYNRYTVLSSKITYRVASIDTGIKGGIFGIVIHNAATTLPSTTDVTVLSEDDDGVHGYFGPDGTASELTKSVDVGKYFTITNPLEDDTLQAVVTAVPSREVRGYCWVAAAPGTTVAGGVVTFMVRISYDVMFTEPKDLNIS